MPRSGPPPAVRLWLPVVVSSVFQIVPTAVISARHASWRGPWGPGPTWWQPEPSSGWQIALGWIIVLVGPAALVLARRYPGPVAAAAAAPVGAYVLLDPPASFPGVALAFAIVLGIVRGARLWVYASVGAVWALTLAIAVSLRISVNPFSIAATTFGVLICIGIGEMIRTRRERARIAHDRWQQRQSDAASAERVRIARELHDVLAHSLSQINVQAGMGLHLIERQPQKAAEALGNIKETSKQALDEVRGVLGVLRDETAGENAPLLPQPDLAQLPALLERAEGTGLDVRFRDGLAEAPPGRVQFALYRLVQEALTNVVRHASATSVSVSLAEEGGDYVLRVTDDGGAQAGTVEHAEGRGILGMRERAALLGGTLAAGPAEKGFEVVARIPMRSRT